MKKNKLLYIFILVVTVFSFINIKAYTEKDGMADLLGEDGTTCTVNAGMAVIKSIGGIFGGKQLSCPTPVNGTTVIFYDNDYSVHVYQAELQMQGNTWQEAYNTLTGSEAGRSDKVYGLVGVIKKYNGKTIDGSIQYISNKKDSYALKNDVPNVGCYVLVDHAAGIHNDEIWMSNFKEELEDIQKKTPGLDDNAKILTRSSETPYKTCNLLANLETSKTEYSNLKKTRRKYKAGTTEYKNINSQLSKNLEDRKTIIEEIKSDAYFAYYPKYESELKLIEKEKKLLTNISENRGEKITGCDVFGPNITPIIKWAINLIRIGGVVLVVVFGVIDFMNILLSGEEKNFKEAGMKFAKRLIALLLLIFIPYILIFLLDLSGVLAQYDIEDVFCVVNF